MDMEGVAGRYCSWRCRHGNADVTEVGSELDKGRAEIKDLALEVTALCKWKTVAIEICTAVHSLPRLPCTVPG